MRYQVTDNSGNEVKSGDTVTKYYGGGDSTFVFRYASRPHKVIVTHPNDRTGTGYEYNAAVFKLTVKEA
jgi:hypothetical protein